MGHLISKPQCMEVIMAKKARPAKKGNKKAAATIAPPHSPREMKKMMAKAMADLLGDATSPEREEAEQLVEKACEARSASQAERFARQALKLDPGQLEAYEILADLAPTPEAAIVQLEIGLREGEAFLGKQMFEENAGHFWGIHETRPYMQLRHTLASLLWQTGRRDEAIGHVQEMLRLNPNDNQGVREILAGWYLEERRFDEAEELLGRYQEGSAAWRYCRALLTFCQEGPTPRAAGELRQAQRANEFLPRFLTGMDVFSLEQPDFYSPGDEQEGMIFARHYLPAWRSTPGALAWLRKALNLDESRDVRKPAAELFDKALQDLPQCADETWEIEIQQLDEEMDLEGEVCRPFVFVAVVRDAGDPILFRCFADPLGSEEVFEWIEEAMLAPISGERRRPGKLLFSSSPLAKAIYKKLKRHKVRCEYEPNLSTANDVLRTRRDFIRQIAKGSPDAIGDLDVADLRDLPQDVDEVWQLEAGHLPVWVGSPDDGASPVVQLIVETRQHLVPAVDVPDAASGPAQPHRFLLRAISFPMDGEARRPGVVQVRSLAMGGAIRETLEALDIRLEVTSDLDAWDEAFDSLSQRISGGAQQRPAVVETAGATPEQIAAVFAAAAEFYRAAPWRLIIGDSILRIEAPSLASTPWFGCVMGQMGETFGIALYESEQYLRDMLRNQNPDARENMRGCSSLVVMFGERHEAAPQDAAAIKDRKLPLAAPEAYPTLMRVKPGMAIGQALLWEVKLMEAVLRAVPAYLRQRNRERQTLTVTACGTSSEVTVEYV
jgi:tetratricopeptide (TPR) repeat protein